MAEYIEREALIAELCKGTIITDDLYGMGIVAGMDAAMKKIKSLPTADVEPVKHGEWETVIYYDEIWGEFDCWKCSLCGNTELRDEPSPYCPNCGAKMDGKSNMPRTEGE